MKQIPTKTVYWVGFVSAVLIIGALCVISALTESRREAQRLAAAKLTGQVDSVEMEAQQAEVFDVAPTPEPTPIPPAVGKDAVEILCDRQPVFIVPTHEDAETLLYQYLEASRIETSSEHTLSAALDCEIIFIEPKDNIPFYSVEEGLKILTENPSLIPVKITTRRRDITDTEVKTESREDSSLPAGTRIVTQVGSPGMTVTVTDISYRGGVQTEASEPVTEVLKSGTATVVWVGTGEFQADTGKKKQTKKQETSVATDIGMTLLLPLPLKSTQPTTPFGILNGIFSRGVDFAADAGTSVTAPGEGIVTFCGERGEYGFTVDIDHGNGCVSRLTHLENVTLVLNQRVFAGDVIGTLSDAGAGDLVKPLLHYELTVDSVPVDPTPYWKES